MTTAFIRGIKTIIRVQGEFYVNYNMVEDNILWLDSEFDFYVQDTRDTYYQFRNNLLSLYGLRFSNHVNSIQVNHDSHIYPRTAEG